MLRISSSLYLKRVLAKCVSAALTSLSTMSSDGSLILSVDTTFFLDLVDAVLFLVCSQVLVQYLELSLEDVVEEY